MLYEELEAFLYKFDKLESLATSSGMTKLKDLVPHFANKDNNKKDLTISANFFERITFVKHSRFVEMDKHKHDFIELTYAFKGSFTQTINDKLVIMNEGDITILDTNVYHNIHKVDEHTIIINILFRKEFFDQNILSRLSENNVISNFVIFCLYKQNLKGRFLYFSTNNNKKVRQYISSAMCEHLDQDIGSSEMINSNITLLFMELLRIFKNNRQRLVTEKEMNSLPTVLEILNYLEKNYQSVTLTKVADHFHFHPNYLSKMIKKNLGKSFSQLKQEIRLHQAKILLENTHLQINRVASETGFTNIVHFYKKFKERYHFTPAEFRRQLQKRLYQK